MANKKKRRKQALARVNAPKKVEYSDHTYKPMSFMDGYRSYGGKQDGFTYRGKDYTNN